MRVLCGLLSCVGIAGNFQSKIPIPLPLPLILEPNGVHEIPWYPGVEDPHMGTAVNVMPRIDMVYSPSPAPLQPLSPDVACYLLIGSAPRP